MEAAQQKQLSILIRQTRAVEFLLIQTLLSQKMLTRERLQAAQVVLP